MLSVNISIAGFDHEPTDDIVYPEGSVIARIVTKLSFDRYEEDVYIGTFFSRWVFEGCISDHTESNWIIKERLRISNKEYDKF